MHHRVDVGDQLMVLIDDLRLDVESAGHADRSGPTMLNQLLK